MKTGDWPIHTSSTSTAITWSTRVPKKPSLWSRITKWWRKEKVDCPGCNGSGQFSMPSSCPDCDGAGQISPSEARQIREWLDAYN